MRALSLAAFAIASALAPPAFAADFTVEVSATYLINGQSTPTLRLTRGVTYTFDVQATGHPFYIKTAQVTGAVSTFDTGVTNNGTDSGALTFQVPASAPPTLYYICGFHSFMTGTIQIVSPTTPPPAVPSGRPRWEAVLVALCLAAGYAALRRRRRA